MNFKLTVRVNPATSRRRATWKGDFLKVNLTAVPERGQANEELLDYLSELLGVQRGKLQITSGFSSPEKTVLISGTSRDSIARTMWDLSSE